MLTRPVQHLPSPPVRTQQHLGAAASRALRRGVSIVELMVGITIGLFILAGASLVLTTQLGDNRRLLLEVQIQQDLRAAADLITRELRGSAYWGEAFRQVWPAAGQGVMPNPYRTVTPVPDGSSTNIVQYYRSLYLENTGIPFRDDNRATSDERGGFKLDTTSQSIKVQLSDGNWQELTDPNVMVVTAFSLVINSVVLPLPAGLVPPPSTTPGCTLRFTARDALMTISVEAKRDSAVKRTLRNRVRLRNDVPQEVC